MEGIRPNEGIIIIIISFPNIHLYEMKDGLGDRTEDEKNCGILFFFFPSLGVFFSLLTFLILCFIYEEDVHYSSMPRKWKLNAELD